MQPAARHHEGEPHKARSPEKDAFHAGIDETKEPYSKEEAGQVWIVVVVEGGLDVAQWQDDERQYEDDRPPQSDIEEKIYIAIVGRTGAIGPAFYFPAPIEISVGAPECIDAQPGK